MVNQPVASCMTRPSYELYLIKSFPFQFKNLHKHLTMDIIPLLQLPEKENMHDTIVKTSNVAEIDKVFLDGNKGSATDREAAIEIQKAMPDILKAAKENNSFVRRCARPVLGGPWSCLSL
jgi:hypothetical protein